MIPPSLISMDPETLRCVYCRKCAQIEMKEEERLAAVVATIDEAVAVVPCGAYVKVPLGDVVTNKSFKG